MAQLCLIRHGQTAWNLEGRWQGHTDQPLNEKGLDQARFARSELREQPFVAVYSSDLQRAMVTAEIIAEPHGLPIKTDPALREINLGEWEGQLLTDIPTLYPEAWAERQRTPFTAQPPGGESAKELALRVIPAISAICRKHRRGEVLIVSHGLALAVFLCYIRAEPWARTFDFVPKNALPLRVNWSPKLKRRGAGESVPGNYPV